MRVNDADLRIAALVDLRDDMIGDFTGGADMATRKKSRSSRNAHAINKGSAPAKRPRDLKGREAAAEERFRELVAWYALQGMDEATARERARRQMRDDTLKD